MKVYNGKLEMPKNYVGINDGEKMDIEGGSIQTSYRTAKQASNYCAVCAAAFAGTGVTAASAAAAGLSTVVIAILGGATAAYCAGIAYNYRLGYNQSEKLRSKYGDSRRCKVSETYMLGVYVSEVAVTLA